MQTILGTTCITNLWANSADDKWMIFFFLFFNNDDNSLVLYVPGGLCPFQHYSS